ESHVVAIDDVHRTAEVIGIVQGDIVGRAGGEGRRSCYCDITVVADRSVGGGNDVPRYIQGVEGGAGAGNGVQIAADRPADGQTVNIIQGNILAIDDIYSTAEVVGVIHYDVVGGAGCQCGRAGHSHVAAVTDEAIGGEVQIA